MLVVKLILALELLLLFFGVGIDYSSFWAAISAGNNDGCRETGAGNNNRNIKTRKIKSKTI